jgi:hypothetical protein
MTAPPAPPPLRTLRYTLDIATSHDRYRDVLGIGIALRAPGRRAGLLVERLTEAWARFPVGSVEVFAMLRALELARDRGLRVVRVRSAANAIRRPLKKAHRAGTGEDDAGLRGAVLRLARSFDLVQFGYVARRKNQTARPLAREALDAETLLEDHPIFASVLPRERRPALPEAVWDVMSEEEEGGEVDAYDNSESSF